MTESGLVEQSQICLKATFVKHLMQIKWTINRLNDFLSCEKLFKLMKALFNFIKWKNTVFNSFLNIQCYKWLHKTCNYHGCRMFDNVTPIFITCQHRNSGKNLYAIWTWAKLKDSPLIKPFWLDLYEDQLINPNPVSSFVTSLVA